MLGTNPTRKVDLSDGQRLIIREIFPTIQGEGPHAGRSATFIRLWGCHLRCWFCDTDFESVSESMTLDAILDRCVPGPRLVVLTGGEPMRQNLGGLIELLLVAGHQVQIETAGNFWFQNRPTEILWTGLRNGDLSIVCSPKGPMVHDLIRKYAKHWKYIIRAGDERANDGLPIVDFQKTGMARQLARPYPEVLPENIYLQPMDEGDTDNEANRNICVDLVRRHGYRLSLQQHKLLGLP